jgi:hypothetical protein
LIHDCPVSPNSGGDVETRAPPIVVITGLDPVIHAFSAPMTEASGTWMAGTSPAMTSKEGVNIQYNPKILHISFKLTTVDLIRGHALF